MNLKRVNSRPPFRSGETHCFQEASSLYGFSNTGSQQQLCKKQDEHLSEWTKDQRRAPVNGLIGQRTKHFMWKENLDVDKKIINNLADLGSQTAIDAAWKEDHIWREIPSCEFQNLIQQETCYPQPCQDEAQSFFSSTFTPASHTIHSGGFPVLCSSESQFTERDFLMDSCMDSSMRGTGSAANKPGEWRDVVSRVSVTNVSKDVVDSPEPISSVTVCSDGDWKSNKEPLENGLTFSDSGLLHIPESVTESSMHPQLSGEVDYNLKNYGGLLENNQSTYHVNVPALSGKNVCQLPNLQSHGCLVDQDASLSNVSRERPLGSSSVHELFPEQLSIIQGQIFCQVQCGSSDGSTLDDTIGSSKYPTSDNLSLHDILSLYINYNSVAVNTRGIQVPFMNYLHSIICSGKRCCCDRNSILISQYENCQYAGICKPVRDRHSVDPIQTESKRSENNVVGILLDEEVNGFNSNVNEATLPPPKRKRVENLPMLYSRPFNADIDSGNQQSPIAGDLSLSQCSEGPLCGEKKEMETSNKLVSCIEVPNIAGDSCNVPMASILQVGNTSYSSGEISSDCKRQKTEHISASGTESDEVENSPGMSLDSVPFRPIVPMDVKEEDIQLAFKHSQTTSASKSDLTELRANNQIAMKSENPKRLGVTLADFFTVEQLKNHVCSLSQYSQGTGNMLQPSISANICQLCYTDRLVFVPLPIYCSSCCARIKRNLVYYWTVDEAGPRYFFCTKCFRESRGGNVMSQGLSISKENLQKAKNNEETEEAWVQCDKCEHWQHQICALYNAKKDLEGIAKYICPFCRLKEIEAGVHTPLPAIGAKDLPRTLLSDHIEQRLFRLLKLEKDERTKLSGKHPDEVPGAADIVVRVVLSVNKNLRVKQQFLDLFHNEDYPLEFQYSSKVILLFQKMEGVDVCLFGMYVQEFGSECAPPNKRCVYISYLDSIKYFRPEIETVKGEALRTIVYHEILIGYLDYCKRRGFATCYIWACPPVKGEDYILYCHPESQKTPKPDKLRLWYRSMLRKASEEGIVVSYTNLYDRFFIPSARNNDRITAAHLPYFDGDYWSGAAEDLIRNIDKESRGDSPGKVKKLMTKRTLKAMGHNNLSVDATKDILVMQKLGQTILPVKEDFIIVNLHVVCTNCHEAILSGSRWFCDQCRNFDLCTRCLALKKNLGDQKTHTSSSGEKHLLSEVVVDDIPADTEDLETIIDNDFFENRHSFLGFCQENHYQFDTLRRAKHSSMMILYHLHNKIRLSKADSNSGREKLKGQRPLQIKLLDVLVHASQCHSTRSNPCSYSGCLKIRNLFQHASRCSVRVPGGCEICFKAWSLLRWHSQTCQNRRCLVPRCMDIKRHAEKKNSLLQAGQRASNS